jgi:hypothetical protein
MTIYTIDPATVDLADFTLRFGSAGSFDVIDDAGTPAIRISADNVLYSYDPVSAVADVDIVIRSRLSASTAGSGALSLARLQTGAQSGYGSGRRLADTTTLISWNSGSVAGLNNTSRSAVPSTSYSWQRFNLVGSTIRQKSWAGTPQDEPAAYDLTLTNTTITAAGLVGIGTRSTGATNHYYSWIGIGTNGDAAPTSSTPSGPDYTQRKGSTFDATHGLGTITTATLNGTAITINTTGSGTVNLTDTSGVTTSGVYNLVLGDGAGTETYTVQLNVFGVVPSNNPAQKDGSALASLTGVQIRVTDGANLNGTEVYYSPTQTTDASGNFNTLDVSTSAAAAADPVRMQVLTAAGDSITSAETVGLI